MEHRLKILPRYFNDIKTGVKKFELRKDNRNFKVGDILVLEEYENGEYTKNTITVKVSYKLKGGDYGLDKDYCILGIEPLAQKQPNYVVGRTLVGLKDFYFNTESGDNIKAEVSFEEETYDIECRIKLTNIDGSATTFVLKQEK